MLGDAAKPLVALEQHQQVAQEAAMMTTIKCAWILKKRSRAASMGLSKAFAIKIRLELPQAGLKDYAHALAEVALEQHLDL